MAGFQVFTEVENFTADYNPLPFTQVRAVSVDALQWCIQFAVDGAWQNPSLLNAVFGVVPGRQRGGPHFQLRATGSGRAADVRRESGER